MKKTLVASEYICDDKNAKGSKVSTLVAELTLDEGVEEVVDGTALLPVTGLLLGVTLAEDGTDDEVPPQAASVNTAIKLIADINFLFIKYPPFLFNDKNSH